MIKIYLKIAAIIKKRILIEIYLESTMLIHATSKQNNKLFMIGISTMNLLYKNFEDDVIYIS